MTTKLQRIAEKASNDKGCQFTSLFHLMNKPLLLECFAQLKGKAASGIDNVTKEHYASNLDANLEDLVRRLHKMAYRPQPVLRVYIPKPGSTKQRPLGIPALEDKLVQAGLVKFLQAIYEQDAREFEAAMKERLEQYHLDIAPEKTKRFEFGLFAQSKAQSRGERPATFDFLGFTHYCSRTRDGKRYRMKRKTIGKRLCAKVMGYKAWLRANRTLPTAQILITTAAKLRGHYAYYGVTDNSRSINSFNYRVRQTLFKWLNRRGKRGCYTWEKFNKLLQLYPLPVPRITVNLLSF